MFTGANRYDHYAPSAAIMTRPTGYYAPTAAASYAAAAPSPYHHPQVVASSPYSTTPRRPRLLDNAFADDDIAPPRRRPVAKDVTLGQFLVDIVNGVPVCALSDLSLQPFQNKDGEIEEYHTRHANGTEFRFQTTTCRRPELAGFWLEALHQQCMRNTTDRATAARRALDWVHAHFAPHVVSQAEMQSLAVVAANRRDLSSSGSGGSSVIVDSQCVRGLFHATPDVHAAKKVGAATSIAHLMNSVVPGLTYLLNLVSLLSADDTAEVVRERYLDADVLGDLVLESVASTRVGLAKIVHLVNVLDCAPPAVMAAQSIRHGYIAGLEVALRYGQVPGLDDLRYTKRVDCPNGANMRAMLNAKGIFLPLEEKEEEVQAEADDAAESTATAEPEAKISE